MKRRHQSVPTTLAKVVIEKSHGEEDEVIQDPLMNAESSEIPSTDNDEDDEIDFDFSGLAANISASLAKQLHSDSLMFSSTESLPKSSNPSSSKKKHSFHGIGALSEITGASSTGNKFSIVANTKLITPATLDAKQNRQLEKSLITSNPSFLTAATVPPVSAKDQKKRGAEENSKDTAGARWFHMSAPTLTPEVKNDLKMIALRSVLDPKRHYKQDKSLMKTPKYFQMGTVVAGAAETYSARIAKSQRKANLVDEILEDSQHRAYLKRRYNAIHQSKSQDPRRVKQYKAHLAGAAKRK